MFQLLEFLVEVVSTRPNRHNFEAPRKPRRIAETKASESMNLWVFHVLRSRKTTVCAASIGGIE